MSRGSWGEENEFESEETNVYLCMIRTPPGVENRNYTQYPVEEQSEYMSMNDRGDFSDVSRSGQTPMMRSYSGSDDRRKPPVILPKPSTNDKGMSNNGYRSQFAVEEARRSDSSGASGIRTIPSETVKTTRPVTDRASSTSEASFSGRESSSSSGDSPMKSYQIEEDEDGYSVTPHGHRAAEADTHPPASRISTEVKLPIKPENKKEKNKKEGTHSYKNDNDSSDKKQKLKGFRKMLSFQGKEKQKDAKDDVEHVYEDIDAIEKLKLQQKSVERPEIALDKPVSIGRNESYKDVQTMFSPKNPAVLSIQQDSRRRKISCPEPSQRKLLDDLPDPPPPPPCRSKIPPKSGYANLAFDPSQAIETIADIPSDLSVLSVTQVSDCLRLLKLHKHVDRFADDDIDGGLLVEYTFDAFMDLGLNKAEAKKLETFVIKGWRPNATTSESRVTSKREITSSSDSDQV